MTFAFPIPLLEAIKLPTMSGCAPQIPLPSAHPDAVAVCVGRGLYAVYENSQAHDEGRAALALYEVDTILPVAQESAAPPFGFAGLPISPFTRH